MNMGKDTYQELVVSPAKNGTLTWVSNLQLVHAAIFGGTCLKPEVQKLNLW